MARIEALMLDVDGVLVTGRPADGLPWATGLMADLGIDPASLHRAFFATRWQDIVTGRTALRPALDTVLQAIAPGVSAEMLTGYWFSQDARLDLDLLAAVGRLRAAGLQVHLATNQEHERMRHLLEVLGLAVHVDGCHYSAALGCSKPQAAFFERVAARTGLPGAAMLLLDDSPANVAAASAAGWRAVRWQPGVDLARAIAEPLAPE